MNTNLTIVAILIPLIFAICLFTFVWSKLCKRSVIYHADKRRLRSGKTPTTDAENQRATVKHKPSMLGAFNEVTNDTARYKLAIAKAKANAATKETVKAGLNDGNGAKGAKELATNSKPTALMSGAAGGKPDEGPGDGAKAAATNATKDNRKGEANAKASNQAKDKAINGNENRQKDNKHENETRHATQDGAVTSPVKATTIKLASKSPPKSPSKVTMNGARR